MQTLSKLVRRASIAPPPLPPMFPSWEKRGLLLRQSSVQMVAGMAGTYKTMVLLNGLANMRVPTLAFSTDSDDTTIASRLLAMRTGEPTEACEDLMRTDPARCEQVLKEFDYLQWQFMSSPSLDDIWHETYAYGERYGTWPQLLVIDILMDVSHNDGDEWQVLRTVIKEAKNLARETRASVLVLHHASEGARGRPCPSRADIMGKASASPTLMVTLGKTDEERLFAACVKNRHGPSDATGRTAFEMTIDPACCRVSDYTPGSRFSMAGALGGPQEETKEWWQ